MANRATGTFTFAANFETEFQGPLDARLTTPELTQLTDGSLPFAYNGMCVAVTLDEGRAEGSADNNGLYILIDDSATPGGDINKWTKLGDAPGGGGNPVTAIAYTAATNELKVTLTHDGSGSGSALEYTTTVDPIYTSAITDTSTNVPNAVGGIGTNNTVADLNGLTQNQMWDKLLFPTVNPTGSGASVTLNDSYNLIEAETTVNMVLTTTANLGTLSNPSGPWAGPVNAAVIEDIGVGNMAQQVLSVGPGDTDIADLTISYITQLGVNKFRLTGSFDQGPMPQDSTGADYPGVRFNAQDKTNTTQFEAVWPIYLGTAADGFEKRGLVGQGQTNISCAQNYGENSGTGLWHRIAVPQAMVTGGDITIQLDAGPLGYQPSYPGSAWVRTSVTFDVHNDAQNIPYYLYTKGFPQGGASTWIVNW